MRASLLAALTGLLTIGLSGAGARAAEPPAPAQSGASSRLAPQFPTVTTTSGLQYVDLNPGDIKSPSPTAGQIVKIHYKAWLPSGRQFDTNQPPQKPFAFVLGKGNALKGLEEGVATMHVGGKRKLILPSTLAYGHRGLPGGIPGDATLVFEVELVSIK